MGQAGLKEKALDLIKEYDMLRQGDQVAAGISGGADSVCLLYLLAELRKEIGFSLTAVHVNHGLRTEAGEDADYVKKLCRQWDVPFVLFEEDVKELAEKWKCSLEEAGRKVRYRDMEQVLLEKKEEAFRKGEDFSGKIAVAHNQNDRAETMLFHFFRGTGLAGMAGIRPVRGNIIRPLLGVSREEIEAFLLEKGISWRIDKSNQENIYTRNKIRNCVLPYVTKEICPEASGHLAAEAKLLEKTALFLERQMQKAWERCVLAKEEEEGNVSGRRIRISIQALLQEDELLQDMVLKKALEQAAGSAKDLSSVHVASVRGLLASQSGRFVNLPYQVKAQRNFSLLEIFKEGEKEKGNNKKNNKGNEKGDSPERIVIRKEELEEKGSLCVQVPGLGEVNFSVEPFFHQKIPQKTYTKWLDYDKIMKSVEFRRRNSQDYLTINDEGQKKKLKAYLIQEKIPSEEREAMMFLAEENHILWVPGHRISAAYKVTAQTKRVLKIQSSGGKESG